MLNEKNIIHVQKEIDKISLKNVFWKKKNNKKKNEVIKQKQNIRSKSKEQPLHGKAFRAKQGLKIQFFTK